LRIAGIDPGSKRTGFAVVDSVGPDVLVASAGCWDVGRFGDRPSTLQALQRHATDWLNTIRPDCVAFESVFSYRSPRSAFVLSESRGALLSAVGQSGLPIAEYAPATVKFTVAGSGAATKEQVRCMLIRTVRGASGLDLQRLPADASDAVAVAVCHALHQRQLDLLARGSK
jgi:crossover junction endodeoxyribonuclease RuvC